MALSMSLFLTKLFCLWFSCRVATEPLDNKTHPRIIDAPVKFSKFGFDGNPGRGPDPPVVLTTLGPIQGFRKKINRDREVFAFTGVPYGEPPVGNLRFRSPVPRRPWKGVWKATSPSPLCVQLDPQALQSGQEDCLYLDIHTPRIPDYPNDNETEALPVLIWLAGGANFFGKSSFYGPNYILREDVVYVVPNIRLGVLGFLSTGDEASPGNWALKDQSLAVQFVYDNIKQFGGDPNKITIGGISSGAFSAQAMLFTNHKTKNYIKRVISLSGTVFANAGLDTTGTVQKTSDAIAKAAGCPTAAEGHSMRMVECLRKKDPFFLTGIQLPIFAKLPPFHMNLCPTIEPNVTGAFITELPERLYEKGEVPAIPLIVTRAEHEYGFWFRTCRYGLLQLLSYNWEDWMQKFLKWGYRSHYGERAKSKEEVSQYLARINQVYFNKTGPPNVSNNEEFLAAIQLADDSHINAPMWKAIEAHHKIAPTYTYIVKHNTFVQIHPVMKLMDLLYATKLQAFHAVEFLLLFSFNAIPKHVPGSDLDIVSRNLINLFVNFANYGEPLYRSPKGELLSLWHPVEDMKRPYVLEVGLLHNITMIRDPLVGTERLKVWETVRF